MSLTNVPTPPEPEGNLTDLQMVDPADSPGNAATSEEVEKLRSDFANLKSNVAKLIDIINQLPNRGPLVHTFDQ